MHCSRDVIECAFVSPHVVSSPKCFVLLSCHRSFPVWPAARVSVTTCGLNWISRECPCFHHPPTATYLQEEGGATGSCYLPLLLPSLHLLRLPAATHIPRRLILGSLLLFNSVFFQELSTLSFWTCPICHTMTSAIPSSAPVCIFILFLKTFYFFC